MRKFNITVAVSVDTDDDHHAKQCLANVLCNLMGNDLGSFKVLETRKQSQVPALLRPLPGKPAQLSA